MNSVSQPAFSSPARWVLRVLSWLAFGVSAYLAWHSINQTSVAGCSVGSQNGCDAVLNSSWSEWLGVPVAVPGLACYATLAALSVLLGMQTSASRWINTAFMTLAFIVAGASLWFVGIQVFAIGSYCVFCLTADICGIAIGAIAAWAAVRSLLGSSQTRNSGSSAGSLAALRSAMPTGARPAAASVAPRTVAAPAAPRTVTSSASRSVPLVGSTAGMPAMRRSAQPPLVPLAVGGALLVLALLIGGQLVFPAKTFEVQQLALNQSINMSGADASETDLTDGGEPTEAGKTRIAMRIPTEHADESGASDSLDENADSPQSGSGSSDGRTESQRITDAGTTSSDPHAETDESSTATPKAKKSRLVKFLDGKLTLDTYKHPIIGSPEAPHVVVELLSYDCTHCRKTHSAVKRALSRYRDDVALIVLVIPMEKRCNRLITDSLASHKGACTTANMALGVANLKRGAFPRFHDFLMKGEKEPPPLTAIISKAYGAVDRHKLRELRDSKELDKQIAANVDLYDMLRKQNANNKNFGLPIQIIGDHVMTGSVESSGDLIKAWEENLDLKSK